MSEFLPENTAPDPQRGAAGPDSYQGMPDLQGEPFDPRTAFAAQPPAPDAATWAQQPAPPAPPYGQPYAQVAPQPEPYGQPYGQPAPQAQPYAAQPYVQNGSPAWNAAPPKKRKVWPWVVGGGTAVVVLGVGAVVAVLFLGKAAVDGLNPEYDAPPVTEQDVASGGGTLIIDDGADASFEIDPTWVDQSSLLAGAPGVTGDVAISYVGAWSTTDFSAGQDVSLVTVIVGAEKVPVVAATLSAEHEASVKGFFDGLGATESDVQVTDAESATTASGLKGLHSTFTTELQGLALAGDLYTFAHGNNVMIVQVTSYNGVLDEAAVKQILDTARIDS